MGLTRWEDSKNIQKCCDVSFWWKKHDLCWRHGHDWDICKTSGSPRNAQKLFFGNIPVILLVGDDYQLPPIMPGTSANKANPKPTYGLAFVMGIVEKGLNAFNKLGEKVVKLKHPKD